MLVAIPAVLCCWIEEDLVGAALARSMARQELWKGIHEVDEAPEDATGGE